MIAASAESRSSKEHDEAREKYSPPSYPIAEPAEEQEHATEDECVGVEHLLGPAGARAHDAHD
jgi:hypothetical protein